MDTNNYEACAVYGLLLGLQAVCCPAPARQTLFAQTRHESPALLTPRLDLVLSETLRKGESVQGIRVTPLGAVLLLQQADMLIALDRVQGRELWRRISVETPAPSSARVRGAKLSTRLRRRTKITAS